MGRSTSSVARGSRSTGLRGANRAAILQQLRRNQPLSRADIARRITLSEGSVSRIVAELLREKLVSEGGAEGSTGGRPGTRLSLDSSHVRAIGVEIQNLETRVSVGSVDGKLLETQVFRTPSTPQETLEAAAVQCEQICGHIGTERLEGVGLAVRGVVNNETGAVEIGNTPDWNGVAVREFLEPRLQVPVYVDNNVRLAALAEYNSGASDLQGNRCLLFVRIDEGIGVGIVLNGEVYRGPHMAAGEFGEMVVADSPGGGSPSRPGCLEALAANPALCDRYAEFSDSPRRLRSGDTSGRVRTICHLAMQGEPAAREAIAIISRYLGIGIANLVWGFNPDVIIIDGAITDAWPLVLAGVMEQLPGRELPNFRNLIIRSCGLGADAPLTGALLLPFGPLFATGERAVTSTLVRPPDQ